MNERALRWALRGVLLVGLAAGCSDSTLIQPDRGATRDTSTDAAEAGPRLDLSADLAADTGQDDSIVDTGISTDTTIDAGGSADSAVDTGASTDTTIDSSANTDSTVDSGASSSDNPDDYTVATSVYVSRDYESENAATDMWINGGGSVAQHSYHGTGGYLGSGAWRATPTPITTTDNETSAGWSAGDGNDIPVDDTNVLVISYVIYVSQPLADAILAGTGGFWHSGNKVIDVFMWNVAGTEGDRDTRQVIKVLQVGGASGHVSFAHLVGGAGTDWADDGRGQNIAFEASANQWVWVSHVFDATAQVTRTYFKRSQDSGVTKALERFNGQGPEAYVYGSRGWTLLRPGGGPASSIWGYWDDIFGVAFDATRYVMLDRLRIANGWVDPPF